jgi:hypothetical protein
MQDLTTREHEQSYHTFTHKHLFAHIDIDPRNVHILDGNAPNLVDECARYEDEIQKTGGIELFLAGLPEILPLTQASVQTVTLRSTNQGAVSLPAPELKPWSIHSAASNPGIRHHHRQLAFLQQRHPAGTQNGLDGRGGHNHGRKRSGCRDFGCAQRLLPWGIVLRA